MITVLIFLLCGMLAYLLIDFATFRKGFHNDDFKAFPVYLHINWPYILAGAVIGIVATILMFNGQLAFLQHFGFRFAFDVTGQSQSSAFVFGLLNQWMVVKIRKFTKSMTFKPPDIG